MQHSQQQLADNLTEEPIVFMGCTNTEIFYVIGAALALSTVLAVVLVFVSLAISPSLALLAGAAGFFGGGFGLSLMLLRRLQALKEMHGDNYYKERLHLYMSELGLGDQVFTLSQRFGRGRSL